MIYIEDYRKLPTFREPWAQWNLTRYLGKKITVVTDAGVFSGIATGEDDYTISLAYTRTVRNRCLRRQLVISKAHITAIETYFS